MLGKALVDRLVDLLPHVAGEALPALAAGGGQLLDAFLFKACPQFGLAPPLLAIALLPLAQLTVKGAVVLAVAGRQKVGNAHVHADYWGRGSVWTANHLIVAEGEPPAIPTLVERHAAY